MKPSRTIELFCGIGGFRLASDAADYQTIWANDIEPKACQIYKNKFGRAELFEGDIRQHSDEAPEHDLLTGGFPCQPFSSAGKKNGLRDSRGTLFEEIVKILRRRRPRFFVLENVKRLLAMESGCHFATILAALSELDYQIEWRVLNAMDFGLPQNRQRVILLGSLHAEFSHFDLGKVKLAPSSDFAAVPPSSLESIHTERGWKAIDTHGASFPFWGVANRGRFTGIDLTTFSHALPLVKLAQILEPSPAQEFDFTDSTQRRLGANSTVNKYVGGVEILSNQSGGARMGYTIFGINGVAPTLTAATSRHYERYKIGSTYRRLTNVEYARIQGFPDNHCAGVSIYDQYALYGNAVPPPLVKWVLSRLFCSGDPPPKSPQLTMESLVYGN